MPQAFGPAGEQNTTPPAEVQAVSMAASHLSLFFAIIFNAFHQIKK